MKTIFYLLIFLSFSLSLFTLGMSFILNRIYKRRTILYFMLIIVGLALDVFSFGLLRDNLLPYYSFIKITNLIAASILTFGIPLFIFNVLYSKISSVLKYISFILFILQSILSILHFYSYLDRTIVKIPLYLSILFSVSILAIKYKNIGNQVVRRALVLVLINTVLHLPVLIVNEFNFAIFYLTNSPVLLFVSPLYNFFLSIILIAFSYNFFNQPYYMKDNIVTEYFIDKYSISKREIEVLNLVMNGQSREEIGNNLYISNNTVNNHIYNIYRKLNVKNRVQLLNLIQTNSN